MRSTSERPGLDEFLRWAIWPIACVALSLFSGVPFSGVPFSGVPFSGVPHAAAAPPSFAGAAAFRDDPVGPPVAPEVVRRAVLAGRLARQSGARPLVAAAPWQGALVGRSVAVSPGHGRFFRWEDANGNPFESWDWQRGVTQDLREDIHTAQIAIDFIIPLLERAGARVVHVRERSFRTPELLLDNDDGGAVYREEGSWEASGTPGFGGGSYRYAYVSQEGGAEARWSFAVPESGDYPVYVWFLASWNRSRAARYRVEHGHGASERVLDQGALRIESAAPVGYPNEPPVSSTEGEMNARWHYLGTFPFRAGETAAVVLTNAGEDPETVVIADAVRVGADESGVLYGGETSGVPRWQEAAIIALEAFGAPEWVRVNDVVTRPLYAVYEGVDAYFAFHTNCCESSGTSMYTWYPDMWIPEASWTAGFAATGLPPGTYAWSDAIHQGVLRAIRTNWDPDWRDRGHMGADFGELRVIKNAWAVDREAGVAPPLTIPAALIETAFHDTQYDASLIREMNWRHDVARGIVSGMVRYFTGDDGALVPPLAPAAVAVLPTATGVRVVWQPAPDPVETNAAPTVYRLYVSDGPLLFPEVPALETAALHADLDVAPCDSVYVRVAGANAAGESLPGPTLGARRAPAGEPVLLWVNGVDREVKTVWDPNSRRDWARVWGPALEAAGEGGGFFGMATDDAVGEGLVELADFAAVAWSTGETSRRDGAFLAAERDAIESWLATKDGRLAVNGAEIGWDLVEAPVGDSARFLPEVLHVDYQSDDADDTAVTGVAGGPFAGFGALDFGLCEGDGYCVEWPDVLGPLDAGRVVLAYAATGDGAAVEYDAAGDRVLTFGFPLETVADPDARRALVVATMEALIPSLGDHAPDCTPIAVEPGPEPVADVAGGDAGRPDVVSGPDVRADGGSDAPSPNDGQPDVPSWVDLVNPGRDAASPGPDGQVLDGGTVGPDGGAPRSGSGSSSCAHGGAPQPAPWSILGLLLGAWAALAGVRAGRRRSRRPSRRA